MRTKCRRLVDSTSTTIKHSPNTSIRMMPPPPPPPPRRGTTNGRPVPPPPPQRYPPSHTVPRPPSIPASYSAAPPPPPPRPHYEPYGEVPSSTTESATSTHRRHVATSSTAAPSPYGNYGNQAVSSAYHTPSSYPTPIPIKPVLTARHVNESSLFQYQHNVTMACFLLPSLASVLWWHESPLVLQTFLILGLLLYVLDLMNARDSLTVMSWISALVLTMLSGVSTLLHVDDSEASGAPMILCLIRFAVEGCLFCLLACWCNLQCAWLHRDVPSIAKTLEGSLHSVAPPITASILSYHTARWLMNYWGLDRVATLLPHMFAILMMVGMMTVGEKTSSFEPHDDDKIATVTSCSITPRAARCHSLLLLLVPGSMHLVMFQNRILSSQAGSAELYDVILVWTIPYLLHCGLLLLQGASTSYAISKLFPDVRETTLRGAFVPMVVSLLASVAAQQRYMIPLCHKISYQFNGHNLPSSWVVSSYLTLATLCTLFAGWTWGRKSSVTGELLFGEYHEDAVQLTVSASGLLLGRAFGLPWNLTPLPILAFLGLSVWVTTRMLRYLIIFLFVLHAGSVVLFSYRFASINITMPLAIPGIEVHLIRFGTIVIASSVLIFLVAGFAVRPSGGVGAAFLKRVDVPGIVLIVYELMVIVLEITLLKRPAPHEQMNHESDIGVEDAGFLYDHATALLTSLTVVFITLFARRLKVVSKKAGIITVSLAIGKAIAVIIDANEVDGKVRSEVQDEVLTQRAFKCAMVGAFLLVVLMAPRAVLNPIYSKTPARHKRSLADGKPIGAIPTTALRSIVAYTMVILPVSLMSSVPMVLTPLVMVFSSHYYGGAYYKVAPPLSEMTGFALTLWGAASLAMVNYYLPDGGAETVKKASALTFLMGIGVTFSAPTVPDWMVGDNGLGVSNPYAAISSLGTTLVSQDRNRTGGWGILAASLATLLAITGPLELRERRHPSGKKDQFLLFRLMVFSLLFGSGVSWFITIQSMGQEGLLELVMTGFACMVVSFFGTVTCVMGYFLQLENFDEVDQIAKIWVGTFCLFGLVTCVPALLVSSTGLHAFGAGGWLSTYLAVSSLSCFSLTISLRLRTSKNSSSRGLGNASCVLAYGMIILGLYGVYGVSGMDDTFAVTTFFGVSASVLGTFVAAPILLALEGENGIDRQSRVSRISGGGSRSKSSAFALTLSNLNDASRLAVAVAATVGVFTLASFYAIFLRGSFLFPSVATSHTDLFLKVTGGSNLAQLAQQTVSHNLSLKMSARMAGSGFWTAPNPLGPLLHLAGLACVIPSVILLLSQIWSGSQVAMAQIIMALPLNLIPLLFCRGVPTVPAAAVVGTVGGLIQLVDHRRTTRRSQMHM